jgi:hypothetical protein
LQLSTCSPPVHLFTCSPAIRPDPDPRRQPSASPGTLADHPPPQSPVQLPAVLADLVPQRLAQRVGAGFVEAAAAPCGLVRIGVRAAVTAEHPPLSHAAGARALAAEEGPALVDIEDPRTIGARLRLIHSGRRKSLRVIAALAGMGKSKLSQIECGEIALDSISEIVALANALQVAPSELMRLPVPAPANGTDCAVEAVR